MRARIKMNRGAVKALRRALKGYLQDVRSREEKCEVWIGDGEVHEHNVLSQDINGLCVDDLEFGMEDVISTKVKFFTTKETT